MRKLNNKQIVAICAWLAVCVYCVLDRKAFYGTPWNMYDRLGVALITACMTVVFLSDKERQRIQEMIRRKKERKDGKRKKKMNDGKEKTMKIEGVIYPHAYLWKASNKSLKMAETNEREQYYLLMQSLLTAYLAFEAFINSLGECLDPYAWKEEKTFFNQSDYKGIEGKIKRIAENLPEFNFKKGERPYQVIKKAGEFRDLLAHGKPHHYTKEVPDLGHKTDAYEFNWDEHLSLRKVEEGRKAIEEFCESLNSEANAILEERDHPSHPFLDDQLGSWHSI